MPDIGLDSYSIIPLRVEACLHVLGVHIHPVQKLAKIRPENCPGSPLLIWTFLTYEAEQSAMQLVAVDFWQKASAEKLEKSTVDWGVVFFF